MRRIIDYDWPIFYGPTTAMISIVNSTLSWFYINRKSISRIAASQALRSNKHHANSTLIGLQQLRHTCDVAM